MCALTYRYLCIIISVCECVWDRFLQTYICIMYIYIGNPGNNNRNYQSFVIHNVTATGRQWFQCQLCICYIMCVVYYYRTVLLALFLGLLFCFISRSRTKHVSKHLPINIYTGVAWYDRYEVNLLKTTICLKTVWRNNMHRYLLAIRYTYII